MDDVLIAQATDILQATLPDLSKKRCVLTYAYSNYGLLNSFMNGRIKLGGGDKVERFITLGDEGNAGHRNRWAEDTHNVVNTDHTISAEWVLLSGNLSWNTVEQDMNKGAARIYDKIANKYDNAIREMADELYYVIPRTPTSASDKDRPHGIAGWLSLGDDGDTGSWSGDSGRYDDGSAPGTAYDIGGISGSTYDRWSSYYADHDGDLDDSLLVLLDRACRKLNFQGPQLGKTLTKDSLNFSLYSNDNVIGNINLLYAKSDDQMGIRVGQHFGDNPVFKGMTFQYVDLFDTADTDIYGTDPIFGVNHNLLYPMVLNNWDMKIGKPRQRDKQHLVMTVDMDMVYAIICDDRRRAGFQISQRP